MKETQDPDRSQRCARPLRIFVITLMVSLVTVMWVSHFILNTTTIFTLPVSLPSPLRPRCHNVITNMLRGHWEPHPLSNAQKREVNAYYDKVLKKSYGIRYGIQRPDKLCGNVHQGWLRALCNPVGPTPCCYNFTCVNKTSKQCSCNTCFDLRKDIEADHATWHTDLEVCQPYGMDVAYICDMLLNATIYFLGDSLIRQLYFGVIMQVNGSDAPYLNQAIGAQCRGKAMFSKKMCRRLANTDLHLCNSTLKIKYAELRNLYFSNAIQEHALELCNRSRTLLVFGFGLDDYYNFVRVQRRLLIPLLKTLRSGQCLRKPQLVWTSPHTIGQTKALGRGIDFHPEYHQDYAHTKAYTEAMERFCREHHIPYLNSFYATHGVRSHDGTHYGLGMNKLRALTLLHHIEELRQRNEW